MPIAILSVHDKTGIIEFAQDLVSLGWTLLASGGTAKLLRDNDISVTEVADYTKSPEILGGRVKTLHPDIIRNRDMIGGLKRNRENFFH